MKISKLTIQDITRIGMMVAIIEVCKVTLMGIPNVELTTFWLILFTLYFGKKIYYVIPVFILIEGFLFGIQIWWIMYLYTWPLLAFITRKLNGYDSVWIFSILSGAFGLLFGMFCSLPYIVIGATENGFSGGLYTAFAWWVAGIPYDLVHGISNFIFMLILYKPIRNIMNKLPRISQSS